MSKTVSIINNCSLIIMKEDNGFYYGEVWKDEQCIGQGSLGKTALTAQELYDIQFRNTIT